MSTEGFDSATLRHLRVTALACPRLASRRHWRPATLCPGVPRKKGQFPVRKYLFVQLLVSLVVIVIHSGFIAGGWSAARSHDLLAFPPFADLSASMRHLSPLKRGPAGVNLGDNTNIPENPPRSPLQQPPGRSRGNAAVWLLCRREGTGQAAQRSPACESFWGGGGGPNAARRFTQLVESAGLRRAGKGVWRAAQRSSFILLSCFEQRGCVGGRRRRYAAFLNSETEENRLVLGGREGWYRPLSSSPPAGRKARSGRNGLDRRAEIVDGEERRQLEGRREVSEASPRGGERSVQKRAVAVFTPGS